MNAIRYSVAALLFAYFMFLTMRPQTHPFKELQPSVTKQDADKLKRLGKFESEKIVECSGAARSLNHQDAFWTLNDSGHLNEIYLVAFSGELLATCKLQGFSNRDWESLSAFSQDGKNYLLIADVGDNLVRRKDYKLALIEEPKFKLPVKVKRGQKAAPIVKTLKPSIIPIEYSDGSHNCEAITVDSRPGSQSLYLIEKIYVDDSSGRSPRVYKANFKVDSELPKHTIIAKPIAKFPIRNVTGMAIDESGTQMIVRNYLNAHLLRRDKKESWDQVFARFKPQAIVMPLQQQSEAVFFTADSKWVVTTSEGRKASIWSVRLPKPTADTAPPAKDSTKDSTKKPFDSTDSSDKN